MDHPATSILAELFHQNCTDFAIKVANTLCDFAVSSSDVGKPAVMADSMFIRLGKLLRKLKVGYDNTSITDVFNKLQ